MSDQRPLVQVTGTAKQKQHVNTDLLLVGAGIKLASGQTITFGSGNPEGVVEAINGSLFLRDDGGTNSSVYRKESDTTNVGWVPLVAAGGGGGANGTVVNVDFGSTRSQKAQVVLTGLSWVSAAKGLSAEVKTPVGVDPDEMFLLKMFAVVSDIVNGDGFTLTVYCENTARGVYPVMIVGN